MLVEMVPHILKADKPSVIVIRADHGSILDGRLLNALRTAQKVLSVPVQVFVKGIGHANSASRVNNSIVQQLFHNFQLLF